MDRICRILVPLCLLATATSMFRVYPHQLAYFNEAAGGPENGHKHLLGSNLDWGQWLPLSGISSTTKGVFIYSSYNAKAIDRSFIIILESTILRLYSRGEFPSIIDELHLSYSGIYRLIPNGEFIDRIVSHGLDVTILPDKCIIRKEHIGMQD